MISFSSRIFFFFLFREIRLIIARDNGRYYYLLFFSKYPLSLVVGERLKIHEIPQEGMAVYQRNIRSKYSFRLIAYESYRSLILIGCFFNVININQLNLCPSFRL